MTTTKDASVIAQELKSASRTLFLTGAGISADSGLPVYRGQGGLYNSGVTDEGIPFEVALSEKTLREKPNVIWNFLQKIESANRNASPSLAHRILADFQHELPGYSLLVTQNVDGLHGKAGSRDVLELHGNLYRIRCDHCEWKTSIKNYDELDKIKICPECNFLTRPDVVLFGELLPFDKIDRLMEESENGFDIGFAIGTTGSFHYIKRPFEIIKENGGLVVEINPCDTDISHMADYKIKSTASEGLEVIRKYFDNKK
ncbi:MAG: hypothetical protein A2283_04295 [Lentisphaerae bacterium RIFOXYA12_FULL_48_11]|nr:MAG: hypothetical protein A2283_04295 [Lentisphaerae bacterium RIFOXYA12_FULL_48_11]